MLFLNFYLGSLNLLAQSSEQCLPESSTVAPLPPAWAGPPGLLSQCLDQWMMDDSQHILSLPTSCPKSSIKNPSTTPQRA